MLNIEQNGFDKQLAVLQDLADTKIATATAITLTRTAKDVKQAEREMLKLELDRAKPYTINSVFLKPAKKDDLSTVVWIKDASATAKGNAASEYLAPLIIGSNRSHKKFERWLISRGIMKRDQFAVPSVAAKLDRYGNISRAQLTKAMSNIKAHNDRWQNSSTSTGSKRRRATNEYFLFEEDGTGNSGIWLRKGINIIPFLLFRSKAPKYRKQLPFYQVAERTTNKNLGKHAAQTFREFIGYGHAR